MNFSAGVWTRALEKDRSSKFHVAPTRHAIILPGGKGYPHLTIDLESTHFSKDRREVFVEFSMAHYSIQEKSPRIAFYDNGRGRMVGGDPRRELEKNALEHIDKLLRNSHFPIVFADRFGRTNKERAEQEFFEPSSVSLPTATNTETEIKPELETTPEGAQGMATPATPNEQPGKKKKKKKKKGQSHEDEMRELDELIAAAKLEDEKRLEEQSKSGPAKAKPVKKESQADKGVMTDEGFMISEEEHQRREAIRREWEDFLQVPDFDFIGDDLGLDTADDLTLTTSMSLYNSFLNKLGELSKVQLDLMKKKMQKAEGVFERIRNKTKKMDDGSMNKMRGMPLLHASMDEIGDISERPVPSQIRTVAVHHFIPPGIGDHKAMMLPYYRMSIGLFFSTMGVYFIKIRALEFYSMILTQILHISKLHQELDTCLNEDLKNVFYLMIQIENSHSVSADAILPHDMTRVDRMKRLPQYHKDKFKETQEQLDIARDLWALINSVIRKSLGMDRNGWNTFGMEVRHHFDAIPKVKTHKEPLKGTVPQNITYIMTLFEALEQKLDSPSAVATPAPVPAIASGGSGGKKKRRRK
ncbi:hypothetical protein FUAX_38400 (plasmid) [Fulvitalea axinellae]|uniref:Uncharacterized protein n=2 Tax=Fulvitalea axinellae TaxID=1182444 RepID=A0AAU9D5W8_9BACT|nr:hypothetical protein FUAX_38400 [Fulvitalea axinellae]